jgi:ACR3 family arsenite efflux pump ArsB
MCPTIGRPVDEENVSDAKLSPADETWLLKELSFLYRFLAIWILLAMILVILLEWFVSNIDEVLETATFGRVSASVHLVSMI